MPELQEIAISKIKPSPYQTRRFTDAAAGSLKELAHSIGALGVLEPILVRTNGGKTFELLAGERRLRASKIAGLKKIPAIVRNLTDDEAMEVTISENLHREDLHPLDEAEAIRLMLERHEGDVDEVAGRLGRPRSFVARRSRLTTLTEAWRRSVEVRQPLDDVEDGICRECGCTDEDGCVDGCYWVEPDLCSECDDRLDLSHYGVGQLEVIAKLAPEDQDALLEAEPWPLRRAVKVIDVEMITATWLRKLSSAPWKTSDPELLEDVGACTDCPLRASATPGLFDDVESGNGIPSGDRCLSASCWDRKLEAHLAKVTAAILKETGKEPIRVTVDWQREDEGTVLARSWRTEISEEPKRGYKPGVRIDGPQAGQMVYVRVRSESSSSTSSGPKKGKLTMKEKRERLRRRRYARAIELAHAELEVCDAIPPDDALLTLAAATGTDRKSDYHPGNSWWTNWYAEKFEASTSTVASLLAGGRDETVVRLLWLKQLRPVVLRRTTYNASVDIDVAWQELSIVAGLIGLDLEPLMQQAIEEIAEPKSWAKQEAV